MIDDHYITTNHFSERYIKNDAHVIGSDAAQLHACLQVIREQRLE